MHNVKDCRICNGKGVSNFYKQVNYCNTCLGSGTLVKHTKTSDEIIQCFKCHGTGLSEELHYSNLCTKCMGSGFVYK